MMRYLRALNFSSLHFWHGWIPGASIDAIGLVSFRVNPGFWLLGCVSGRRESIFLLVTVSTTIEFELGIWTHGLNDFRLEYMDDTRELFSKVEDRATCSIRSPIHLCSCCSGVVRAFFLSRSFLIRFRASKNIIGDFKDLFIQENKKKEGYVAIRNAASIVWSWGDGTRHNAICLLIQRDIKPWRYTYSKEMTSEFPLLDRNPREFLPHSSLDAYSRYLCFFSTDWRTLWIVIVETHVAILIQRNISQADFHTIGYR